MPPPGIERQRYPRLTSRPEVRRQRDISIGIPRLSRRRYLRVVGALESKHVFGWAPDSLGRLDGDESVGPCESDETPPTAVEATLERAGFEMRAEHLLIYSNGTFRQVLALHALLGN